jgi:hypothetical protein
MGYLGSGELAVGAPVFTFPMTFFPLLPSLPPPLPLPLLPLVPPLLLPSLLPLGTGCPAVPSPSSSSKSTSTEATPGKSRSDGG